MISSLSTVSSACYHKKAPNLKDVGISFCVITAEALSAAALAAILALALTGSAPLPAFYASIPGGTLLLVSIGDCLIAMYFGFRVEKDEKSPKAQNERDEIPPILQIRSEENGNAEFLLTKKDFDLLNASIDDNFENILKGKTFINPANGLEHSKIVIYQRLLLEGLSCESKEIIINLFVKELLKVWRNEFEEGTRTKIKYFSEEVIQEISEKIPDKESKNRNLYDYLINFNEHSQRTEVRRSVLARNEILRQLKSENLNFYFGTAEDNGGCFFQSLAELISENLHISVTEKDLRLQILEYIEKLERAEGVRNWVQQSCDAPFTQSGYAATKGDIVWTASELDSFSNRTCTWGRPDIEGAIIAELYNVTIWVYEGSVDDEGNEAFEGLVNKTQAHKHKTSILLEDLQSKKGLPTHLDPIILRCGSMDSHFFPIFSK